MANENQLPNGSVDPNVVIPKHIRDASAQADAIHKQVYEQPAAPQAPDQEPQPAPQPEPHLQEPPQDQPEPAPAAQPDPAAPTEGEDENSQTYKQKFLSMQGRWQSSERRNGALKESNEQLAAELQATQELLTQNTPQPRSPASPHHDQFGQQHENLITERDRETYGDEMLDTVRRAAREAVQPELDALRGENEQLKKRVISTGQRDVQAALTRAVPDWAAINRSPEFLQWLSLRNIYTGQIRRQLLNDAYRAANAAVVVQTFKDFLTEVRATGGTPPTSQRQQPQPLPAPAPRQPAMALETLAAPGRARPAPGDSAVPAEKPIYTRAQIARFYADSRRGVYAGREAEKNSMEADIIAAQSEGRVRG